MPILHHRTPRKSHHHPLSLTSGVHSAQDSRILYYLQNPWRIWPEQESLVGILPVFPHGENITSWFVNTEIRAYTASCPHPRASYWGTYCCAIIAVLMHLGLLTQGHPTRYIAYWTCTLGLWYLKVYSNSPQPLFLEWFSSRLRATRKSMKVVGRTWFTTKSLMYSNTHTLAWGSFMWRIHSVRRPFKPFPSISKMTSHKSGLNL